MRSRQLVLLVLALAAGVFAQSPTDPFPTPIPATQGVIRVRVAEFASVPDVGGEAARMMLLVDEPGTRRLFVNDMRGPLYTVSYDGRTVTPYLDVNKHGVPVQSMGRERGFQSFAIHPQFAQAGTPGFGKLYVWTDTSDRSPTPDFRPGGGNNTHHTVLLEFTARTPGAATYDGGPPRELLRVEQPFANHNAGHVGFHPLAKPGSPEFGLLYVACADGGSGGDPLNLAQNLGSPFGKLLRIDPLGGPQSGPPGQHSPVGSRSDPTLNSGNRKYGIPPSNPFVGKSGVLGEIYAYGLRNPQRFGWDPRRGILLLADIGQNIVEELSVVTPGANLGWNKWEGSFGYISRQAIDLARRRADPSVTYPVVEYDHQDPLLLPGDSAITGVHVYRGDAIPQLTNLVLFSDFPSGEIFYIQADKLPNGGQDAIRRVLLHEGGESKTFLQLIREKNARLGKPPASRADLRFGAGADGRVFLLNKHDGTIRLLVADGVASR